MKGGTKGLISKEYFIEDIEVKKMICLMEEQLSLYKRYIRRIDLQLFSQFEKTSEFEYLNKYYIKNFKNGAKFLYGDSSNLPIINNYEMLLKGLSEESKYTDKNFNIKEHTLCGDITTIYDLGNGYDIRYDYYGHSHDRITLCETQPNIRICNIKNKVIYEFSDGFMHNHIEAMYPIDRYFIEEIIDFDEKSILKDDEEYHNAGINQLKKKEKIIINEIIESLEVITNDGRETPKNTMHSHLLRTKPADYDSVLSLDYTKKIFNAKKYESLFFDLFFIDVTYISKKIFYNLTNNLDEIICISA